MAALSGRKFIKLADLQSQAVMEANSVTVSDDHTDRIVIFLSESYPWRYLVEYKQPRTLPKYGNTNVDNNNEVLLKLSTDLTILPN